MTIRHYAAVLFVPMLIGTACTGRPPTAPGGEQQSVSGSPAPVPTPAPPPGQQPAAFELTGVVRGDDGTPVSGAKVALSVLTSTGPGTLYTQMSVTTNALGAYALGFSAVSGAMKGPAGTDNAVAFAYVSTDQCITPAAPSTCAYEADYRYVLSATPMIQDFRLHRVTRVTAGESTVLTVEPHDTICVNNVQDMHPWPMEFVCRTVRIVAPVDGVMTVEAIPVDAGAALPNLQVETVGAPGACCSERLENPTSISVTKGTVVKASVEVPWGAGNHSFVVKTSMAAK